MPRPSRRKVEDPLIEEALGLAMSGGAVLGLEALVWAAVQLLSRRGRREAALKLTDEVVAELTGHVRTRETENQWRLLLAFTPAARDILPLAIGCSPR